mgnify:CR=1 FL=1
MILRFLKIILIVAVILVITISIILLLLSMQPFVPNNYTQIVKTGGELEAKYLAMGASQVEHMEVSTEEEWGNINVYYPKELTESAKSYPVVVMVNGTGVYSSKYPALFKHLASWGFIVIGNEDPSTCSGSSADTTLAWLLNENENPDSRFYQKVDEEHIGQPFSHTTGSGRSTEYALRTGQNEYSSIPSGGNGERRYYARWCKTALRCREK